MQMEYHENSKGSCPICKEPIQDYETAEYGTEDDIGYSFVCPNGHTGTEWYRVVYDITSIHEEL